MVNLFSSKSQNENIIQREKILLSEMSPTKMYYRIAGGGYGNRMYSMISAFMVAKLTNSTFYIDWPVIHKYIEMKYISPSSNDETKTMFEEYQKANQVCDMSIEPANTWMYNKTLNISQGNIYF